MPKPPALVTAAASLPPAADPIGASRIGCSIASSRDRAVSIIGMRDLYQVRAIKLQVGSRPGLAAFRAARGLVGGELTAQGPQLLKPCGGVAHDRGDANHLPGTVGKGHDRELH